MCDGCDNRLGHLYIQGCQRCYARQLARIPDVLWKPIEKTLSATVCDAVLAEYREDKGDYKRLVVNAPKPKGYIDHVVEPGGSYDLF